MDKIEKLISEYESELNFHFDSNMPPKLSGLISGNDVYVNNLLSYEDKLSTVAEEIGHYETSSRRNIINYSDVRNGKDEQLARRWSYAKLIPVKNIAKYDHCEEAVLLYEIADDLSLPDDIVESAIYMYRLRGEI